MSIFSRKKPDIVMVQGAPPEPVITRDTPPDVALSQVDNWQREKELELVDRIVGMCGDAKKRGLSSAGVARVTKAVADQMKKLGGDK